MRVAGKGAGAKRFSEFGERPYYLETLRFAAFQFSSLLLFLVLTFASTLLLVQVDVAGKARATLKNGERQLLLLTLGPPRVGIQIGHDGAAEQPAELEHLRFNTGGYAGGLSELEVNRSVAAALKGVLGAKGVTVDLLRATPPVAYHADLLLAVHADSVLDPDRTGYKSAYFDPPRSGLEPELKSFIDTSYLQATGLLDDTANTTDAMRHYYAFNFRSYRHSVHPATPALIVELGYLSNPADATLLLEPDVLADALAGGIVSFLQRRNRLP